MSDERHETIADIVAEMRKRAEEVYAGQAGYPESWQDQMNDDEIREIAARIEAAHKREVAELRECLVRRSSHLNAILQKTLELRNGVPSELRKVMDECIIAEDKAIGLGVFSKKGDTE